MVVKGEGDGLYLYCGGWIDWLHIRDYILCIY
jgi:hypothetical protein